MTVAAQTKHKVGITISVSGSMAESDDTKVVPPASGSTSTGPAQESGKYDAKYAKVGAAVGFATARSTPKSSWTASSSRATRARCWCRR